LSGQLAFLQPVCVSYKLHFLDGQARWPRPLVMTALLNQYKMFDPWPSTFSSFFFGNGIKSRCSSWKVCFKNEWRVLIKKPPDSWVFIIFFQLLIEKLCATRTEIINNATGCTKSPFQLAFIEIWRRKIIYLYMYV